ncbi:MAG TPA: hypothetical protein VNA25_12425 [Phycisphaerae bacterium]|nr:hypothetical protein [Phycisphaerae bacterium]
MMKHLFLFTCLLTALWAGLVVAEVTGSGDAGASQPTHREGKSLCVSPQTKVRLMSCLCLDPNGNVVVCDGTAGLVKVVSPDDKLVATWKPGFAPTAIDVTADGAVYVGGTGRVAKLDLTGAILKTARAGQDGFPKGQVTSISAAEKDVFVTARGNSGYAVYRFDRDLTGGKEVVTGLRGCCGQMDIKFHDGRLYVAENSRKRIVIYDRDGKTLGQWGRTDRTDSVAFGSCCNPMNICFGPGGELYTSESSVGRVMCFKADGTYLRTVGKMETAKGCTRVTVAVSRDGTRAYVLDDRKNVVHVLAGPAPKTASATTQPAAT